jgi:hypothetical protein
MKITLIVLVCIKCGLIQMPTSKHPSTDHQHLFEQVLLDIDYLTD